MILRVLSAVLACILLANNLPPANADPEIDLLKARVAQLEAEIKSLHERLEKLEGNTKTKADPKSLTITVIPGGWGDAGADDIVAVCKSAASELARHFPDREFEPISIRYDSKRGPMVVFGKGPDGERRVLLNVTDTHWSQFAYQFAHEFCHILCNYRDGNRANLWFEESLCETASLFALRRMAQSWKTKPPYANWKSYADKLNEYAEKRLCETENLGDLTFAQWYARNEPALKKNGTDRQKNQVVAQALLPLLEKNPQGWRAVGYLNQWDPKEELSFSEYLHDWHHRAPKELKPFVAEVAGLFEIKVP